MQLNNEIEMEDYKMGFFKEFKDDFSQAVNELMPGEDALGENAEDDLVVNTLENDVDVESELSKIDGLLEQVANQTAALDTSVEAVQKKQEKKCLEVLNLGHQHLKENIIQMSLKKR